MVNCHLSLRWTGEDSNLRSPQGAADLQSAAINRSATCPRHASKPLGEFVHSTETLRGCDIIRSGTKSTQELAKGIEPPTC